MTIFVTRFGRGLSRLSCSDRFALAVEQAMLDWRHESAQSRSEFRKVFCAFRFALAVLRISVSVAVTETAEIVSSSWALRLAFWVAVVMWMSFSPAAASRQQASAENVVRLWLALSGAMVTGPALTLFTARSTGRAPFVGLTLLSVCSVVAITQVAAPLAAAGLRDYTVNSSWRFAFTGALGSILVIAIAERSRTDQRRWLVTSVMAAAVLFPVVAANAVRIAIRLSDLGVITGNVVYLPVMPRWLVAVFSPGPWALLAVLTVTLGWLVRRRLRSGDAAIGAKA